MQALLAAGITAVLLIVLCTIPALAQPDCVIGVYADESGQCRVTHATRDYGDPVATFDVYYVLFTEDFVNAVAWNRKIELFRGTEAIVMEVDAVPTYGTFLDTRPEGYRLGLGACAIGFGGVPITLMRETIGFVVHSRFGMSGVVSVGANYLEHLQYPVYNSCSNVIKPCQAGLLILTSTVSNVSESWGSVKALYGGD